MSTFLEKRNLEQLHERENLLRERKEHLVKLLDETRLELGHVAHQIKIKTLKAENE